MQAFAYESENIKYWSGRAAGYSAVNQEELATRQHAVWQSVLAEKITAHYPGKAPEQLRVLDIGTGPGFFSIILAELGYQVTAIDYTSSMLDEAKRNAGALADCISFHRMNAEQLAFDDACFDVLVTRNLTWNLPNPEKAYAQWNRVLRPGGLLLNFDANWYSYLHNEEARLGHLQDRENVRVSGVSDDTAGTDVNAMEAIARQTPLSVQVRPGWDIETLKRLHITAVADTEIWRRVWTEEEHTNNASTPMFLVEGHKAAATECPALLGAS